jgi:membrane protein involved in colicin uptake
LKLDSSAIIAAVDIHIIADGPHSGSARAKAGSKFTGAIPSNLQQRIVMERRTTGKMITLGSSRYRDGSRLDFTLTGRTRLCKETLVRKRRVQHQIDFSPKS